jgi:hypothetical protein
VSVSGDLGGQTLTPGVYKSSSSIGLTGALTLDGQGNTSAVFIFQVGYTLTTASASHVNLIDGAQACNVFWQIGSSATLGTSSVFAGNIFAYTSISINNGVDLAGRALARNGAVTLINDTITAAQCATTSSPGPGGGPPAGGSPTPVTPTPRPGSGSAIFTTSPRSVAENGTSRCVRKSFRVVVTGRLIHRVVFSAAGRVIVIRRQSPWEALVAPGEGIRTVTARVTFTDSTPAATLHVRVRLCAPAKRRVKPRPPSAPNGFTG